MTQQPEAKPPVLVTGGTGLYGRSIVRRLVDCGRRVRVLSRRDGRVLHPNVSIHRGDLTRLGDVRAALLGCEAIFHCAAEKYDSAEMTAINVAGTRNIVDLASELRVKFLCHVSSVGVIGKTSLKVVDENCVCNPTNCYEETKLAAEHIVARGIDGGGVVILRPTNVFGPETLRTLVARSIRQRISLFLKGHENAHFVYVEDAAAAALHCWRRHSTSPPDVFIVSSDEDAGVTHAEIQAALAALIPAAPRPLRTAAPGPIPYWIRKMQNKQPNRGDIIYSSRKLRDAGFVFPYGLHAGLRRAALALRESSVDGG